MKTIKKAQLGSLIKKGIKTAAKKTAPKIESSVMEGAMKKAGRADLKAKMKNWDSEMKTDGKVTKAKSGGKFPDLNKDGKVTKADVLKGRGVIAKKGTVIKKAQMGGFVSNEFAAKSISKPKAKAKPKTKYVDSPIKTSKSKDIYAFQGKKGMLAKSGASLKKCRGGCK